MEGHHPHPFVQLHLQQQLRQYPPPRLHQDLTTATATAGDRLVPQWSIEETKEFLTIRGELDQAFMEAKRNKLLWETTASKMKEKGFNRSSEQCKCKWKNLVTRFKGCETIEPEVSKQQFPFYTELHAIFGARMQRIFWAEAGSGRRKSKKKMMVLSSDGDEENEDMDRDRGDTKVGIKKRKKRKAKVGATAGNVGGSSSINHWKEILKNLMNKQTEMEKQWREVFEAREKEREMREMEWRRNMEALEHESIMLEKRWSEIEDQRRMREEVRAEKRDGLIKNLLNQLIIRRDYHT